VAYYFDDFVLDMQTYELRRGNDRVAMEPQVFDVLALLVSNRDHVVTKDELMEKVWGDNFISEAALNSRVMSARKAIGDTGREQRLIRTIHGRGYRFVGDVKEGDSRPGVQSLGPSPNASTPSISATQTSFARPPAPSALLGWQDGHNGAMDQEIRFCKTADGVRIAYASIGQGPVVVKAPNWLTHLEYEWETPVWRHWWEELARDHRVVRFDQRGSGLSDWDVENTSFEDWVSDLEAVVEAAGVDDFALLGISQGGPAAVEYAVRHPDKVSKLVLYGAFVRGKLARGQVSLEEHEALVTLTREGWGRDNAVYRRMFTMQFMPEASPQQMTWFDELERASTSPENAARVQKVSARIDISDRAPLVSVPTLVLHARGDLRTPFREGRELASLIPGARLVGLDSVNHLTLAEEPAWQVLVAEVRRFLDGDAPVTPPQPATVRPHPLDLTPREVEVLRLIAAGKSNQEIAEDLVISFNTVTNHVKNILGKTASANRTEAAAYAFRHGLVAETTHR
jgi:pimeloyl-ACP methyl ester carboxylesterase/DNA-binding winged helix-turn-helix (wHTH) protein/DNA-binding CsgD family transcriptional regulator